MVDPAAAAASSAKLELASATGSPERPSLPGVAALDGQLGSEPPPDGAMDTGRLGLIPRPLTNGLHSPAGEPRPDSDGVPPAQVALAAALGLPAAAERAASHAAPVGSAAPAATPNAAAVACGAPRPDVVPSPAAALLTAASGIEQRLIQMHHVESLTPPGVDPLAAGRLLAVGALVPQVVAAAAPPTTASGAALFCDVRKARLLPPMGNSEKYTVFADEHGNTYYNSGISQPDFSQLSKCAGLWSIAPVLWGLRQTKSFQPLRPDYLQVAIHIHVKSDVADGVPLLGGFTYPVSAPLNTGNVLELLQPGSTDMNHEITKAIIRAAFDHNLVLMPEWPSWSVEVYDGFQWVPLAAVLAFPHLVRFDLRSGAQSKNRTMMKVRVHAKLTPATAMKESKYRSHFSQYAHKSYLLAALQRGDVNVRRLDTNGHHLTAASYNPSYTTVDLEPLQCMYDTIRLASVCGDGPPAGVWTPPSD